MSGMQIKKVEWKVQIRHADVNITYNVYIRVFRDGFDEVYEALCK